MSLSQEQLKQIQLTVADGKLDCAVDASGAYSCTAVTPIKNITGVCVDDQTTVAVTGNVEPPIATPLYFGKRYNGLQLESEAGEEEEWSVYGFVFAEDGSADIYKNGQFVENAPVGTMTYSDNKVYQNGEHVLNISSDKKTLYLVNDTHTLKLDEENVADLHFGQKYSTTYFEDGTQYKFSFIAYEDGSSKSYLYNDVEFTNPPGTFSYSNLAIFAEGKVAALISEDKTEIRFIKSVSGLDVTLKVEN